MTASLAAVKAGRPPHLASEGHCSVYTMPDWVPVITTHNRYVCTLNMPRHRWQQMRVVCALQQRQQRGKAKLGASVAEQRPVAAQQTDPATTLQEGWGHAVAAVHCNSCEVMQDKPFVAPLHLAEPKLAPQQIQLLAFCLCSRCTWQRVLAD